MAHMEEARKFDFELMRKSSSGQPEIERRIDQRLHVGRVEDPARNRDAGFAWNKFARRKCLRKIIGGEG